MNNNMLRFLKSIKIENPERFDLDFDLLARDPFDHDMWDMEIVKDSPWNPDDLAEFKAALENITYRYYMRFSYRDEVRAEDAILLYDGWYFSSYRKNPPYAIKKGKSKSELVITFPDDEAKEKHARRSREFKEFLKWLNYPFDVVEVVERVEETVLEEAPLEEEAPKVIKQKEAPRVVENPIKEAPVEQEMEEASGVEQYEAMPAEVAEVLAKPIEEVSPEEKEEKADAPAEEKAEPEDEHEKEFLAAQMEIIEKMKENQKRMEEERNRQRVFKRGDYHPVDRIKNIFSMPLENVDFVGEIFSIDSRTTRTGKAIYTFGFHDDTSAIYVTAFSSSRGLTQEVLGGFKVGNRVRVRGSIDISKFSKEREIMGHYLDILPPLPEREDPSEEKRVELHLHTKMSAMDGLGDIEDYVATAQRFGMKALAITDHGVIQSFPPGETANKKYASKKKCDPLKMLYGCELFMFDWPVPVFNKISEDVLTKAHYVVFDFETTGLSHTYDRPIEFGAVKFSGSMITDRYDQFINPERELSKEAMEINHITEEMVKDAPTAKEVAKKIRDYIGDAILVAHNAVFDVPFLNLIMKEGGLPPIDNVVIDTLPVADYIFADSARVNEGALAKRLGVSADIEGAFHRADYDAETLAKIWSSMIPLIQQHFGKTDVTVKDLLTFKVPCQNFYRHMRTYHTCVIAKNPQGLKDLYRIISESETTFLSAQSGMNPPTPKVPRDFLEANRKNLFVGSACFNGLVFENALNGTQEDLEREIAFYDYIEVQPIENYSWLINMGMITPELLKEVLLKIVNTARKMGKMVCATGDCHYVDPEDKIFRDIYINAEGLGKTVHPLMRNFRKKKEKFPNPDQHFRSTQEMLDSFSSWLDPDITREIVITNTNKIADQCEPLTILKDKLYKPDANLPGSDVLLRNLCYKNLYDRFGENCDPKVKARLDSELDGIIGNGYAVTYWIAHLLVKKAADDGYFIGSRGSVGSSFAATMADITEVNPLAPFYLCPHCHHFEWANDDPKFKNLRSGFDLPDKVCPECGTPLKKDGQSIPFQTFLGFHAEKVPDIDLNFPADYQARGHLYTREVLSTPEENEMYAKGEVVHEPHVIRAGTIAGAEEKNAFGYVKRYYNEVLGQATPSPDERAWMSYLASRCSGVKRTTGQHPGGIVVIPADMDIFDFTPFQHPADDPESAWLTTHYEFASMHDCVLKLDELGHVDPVALRMQCLQTGIKIADVADVIHCDDPAVLSLFSSPKALKMKTNPLGFKTGAVALPEFGTPFVQGLLEEAKPKTFNDLLIISGLSHGTDVWNNNAENLIVSGTATLNDVIGCRDDIMNYLIGEGVDPGFAFKFMEVVRKNKGLANLAKINDMIPTLAEKGIPEWYLESCRKIQYLFPRAHAAAYVIGAVRAGWFKVYKPLAFYATYFSTRCEKFEIDVMSGDFNKLVERAMWLNAHKNDDDFKDTDKELIKAIQAAVEMRDRGYTIKNIDLMRSMPDEWVIDEKENAIIPPFKVISGFATSAAIGIVKAREDGEFLSQQDLKERVKKLVDENGNNYSIGDSALKMLEDLHVLDGLGKTNQMSLFDFNW